MFQGALEGKGGWAGYLEALGGKGEIPGRTKTQGGVGERGFRGGAGAGAIRTEE